MRFHIFFGLALLILNGSSLAAKPFENMVPAPRRGNAYLNLLNNQRSTSPYQTMVRPLLENYQRFVDNQAQIDRLSYQQQALLRKLPPPGLTSPTPRRGISQNIRATGHQTRFLDGRRFQDQRHFFPQPGQQFP